MEEFNSADILKKQDRKKRFALLEVGLFEISFVLIIVIVLFGILNYFNILSLSKLYPNTFGFLPHKAFNSTPLPKAQLANSPTPIQNQASQAQMLGYVEKVTSKNIPLDSLETPNEFYGIFSGYDNTQIQLVTRKGVKNFPLANNLQISSQATASAQTTESASTETKTLSFNTVDKNTLFNSSQFGKILHIALSADSKSVQAIFLNE